MASDGQIVFEVTADGKHAIADIKEITRAIQQESKKWDNAAEQSTQSISDGFSSMLKKVVGGISAAKIGQMLLNIGKDALQAASDLEEVQNVVDVTFGASAKQIDTWAKNAGTQFGLTETQAKKFASTMGAMMKSSGVAGDEITKMSTDLAGLAADMASFYNLDFDEAFQKIRSGISGETEPLKQLGINMSVANLEAYALSQGLGKTFKEMSQGEQVMLRYQYMMQATADAQGDFSRTSDGYANSMRQMQTNIDGIKTKIGQLLKGPALEALNWINEFLDKLTPNDTPTVLDELNEIDINTNDKLAELERTYKKAQDIIKIIEEIEQQTITLKDGTQTTFAELFKDLGNVEKNGGDVRSYIASLGLDVENVVFEYNKWKEATKQLTDTVPDLASVIDKETGAIDGGTEALKKNLEEWKRVQQNKVYWAAYYAKAEAVARAEGEQAGIQINAKAMANAAERARKDVEDKAGALGIDLAWYEYDYNKTRFGGQRNTRTEEQNAYNDAVDEYIKAQNLANEAQQKAVQSAADLSDAHKILEDEYQATIELVGEEIVESNNATTNVLNDESLKQEAIKTTTQDVLDAVDALKKYAKGVKDTISNTINSVAKGLQHVDYNSYGKIKEKISELTEAQAQFKVGSKEWEELETELKKYNSQLITTTSLYENLESQQTFLEEYLTNLQKARAMGYSNELLASLSDGSTDSAQALSALVNDKNGPGVQKINDLYKKVQDEKKKLTDELTEQQLTVDKVYQQMVEDAKEAVANLDLSSEAAENSGKVVASIAEGINSNVPSVRDAVNAVIAELARLDGWNVGVNIGGNNVQVLKPSQIKGGNYIGKYATGLDYVPFDGFLASLHEGEGILTAEENRIWQRFKDGGRGIDYDMMGGVMRDNIKPGGNVYLDGRVVGSVISEQQGKSYRQLQRSGWQG